jgi:flagellar biosynthesis protein FlhF
MKIKRYVLPDMRSALRAIREEQGPDAVILSTRRCAEGVEVCAAVDVELAAGQGTLADTAALKQLERSALEELQREALEPDAAVITVATSHASPLLRAAEATRIGAASHASETIDALPAAQDAQSFQALGENAGAGSLGEELRSLRSLLEQQLAALAWNDFTRREPLKAGALRQFARLGVDRGLAMQLVEELPAGLTEEQMQRMPHALLARRIATDTSPTERAGALLLIGPSGSGKTTTLAKLATRYVLEQDAANLLIISTDDERLGSHEQLACLGRLLGVRVETIVGADALLARLAALPDRCILIDTPGIGARDTAAAAYYRGLRERCESLRAMLVLPTSAQGGVLEETVQHFGPQLSSCCALTRLDEAVSLGGVLSALARSRLPVVYTSEGPRIPEDLKPARSHQLVARAVELARSTDGAGDDDLLARRYGGMIHAAA